jgi:hypothetical protein
MQTIISHYLIQQQRKNQSLMEDIASQGLLADAIMLQLKKDIHQQQSLLAGLEGMQIYSERAITGILYNAVKEEADRAGGFKSLAIHCRLSLFILKATLKSWVLTAEQTSGGAYAHQ